MGGVEAHGQLTLSPNVPRPGTKHKRSKNAFCCHVYRVHRCTHLYRTVTVSCAVSNRESRYPLCVPICNIFALVSSVVLNHTSISSAQNQNFCKDF